VVSWELFPARGRAFRKVLGPCQSERFVHSSHSSGKSLTEQVQACTPHLSKCAKVNGLKE